MKIIIDARFLGTETGIGRYVKEVVNNLEKVDRKNQYIIFLRKKNWDKYSPRNENFQKKLVDFPWYSLKEQLFLGSTIKKEKADLCHFPHFNVPYFCKTPYVVTIHDLILRHFPTTRASTLSPIKFYLKYFFYNLILKRALKRSKKIIVPSYFVKNDIIKTFKINPDNIRVIYEGLADLPREANLGGEALTGRGLSLPYILYVGNAYPHKNLEQLIRAFFEIKKDKPDLQLVLVGKRDYFSKRLEQEIKGKYLQFGAQYPKDIIFFGFATDQELVTLYKHAELYVFPSLMEGFGLPPLEALSFDLPVVCSDIPVLHEILGNGVLYFDPKDTNNMKEVIRGALYNTEKQVKLLEESKKILRRYSWKKNVEETLEVYKGCKISRKSIATSSQQRHLEPVLGRGNLITETVIPHAVRGEAKDGDAGSPEEKV